VKIVYRFLFSVVWMLIPLQTTKLFQVYSLPIFNPSYSKVGNDATLVIRSKSGLSTFRFLHAKYDSAFWSAKHLAKWIIRENGLSKNSSDFDIVHAAAQFNKTTEFSGGGTFILDSDKLHQALSYVDWQSMWCGDHQKRVANIVGRITEILGVNPIDFSLVAYDDHVLGRYFDRQNDKHVIYDADPNQGKVLFIPDGEGFYASEQEFQANPGLILSERTISVSNSTKWSLLSSSERYLEFFNSRSANYTIKPINVQSDIRELVYRVPEGAELRFSTSLHPKEYLIDTNSYHRVTANAITGYPGPEKIGQSNLRQWLAVKSGFSYEKLIARIRLGLPVIRYSQGQNKPISVASYMELILPAGTNYDTSNLQIPHYLRSISFKNKGTATINGINITDHEYFPMYINSPRKSRNEKVVVSPTLSFSGNIPIELGTVIATFWINYNYFTFWKETTTIIPESGSLDTRTFLTEEKEPELCNRYQLPSVKIIQH
jgi:hypothetical protein